MSDKKILDTGSAEPVVIDYGKMDGSMAFQEAKKAILQLAPDIDQSLLKDPEFPPPPKGAELIGLGLLEAPRRLYWDGFIQGFATSIVHFEKKRREDERDMEELLAEAVLAVKELSNELEDLKGLDRGTLNPLTFSMEDAN